MSRCTIVGFTFFVCLVILGQVDCRLPKPAKYAIKEIDNWPKDNVTFGQLSAVAFDIDNNVVLLHRGHHVWDETTFFPNNSYTHIDDGPITAKTVVVLHNSTGEFLDAWGANEFYMPHGLTIDGDGNVWVTDVALHQVFKFGPKGQMLLLTLGVKFEPGNDDKHFCKPTSVAVLDNGEFFVADGYCNSRVIKYTRTGELLFQWGVSDNNNNGIPSTNPSHYSLLVPHDLALINSAQEVCVADREHGRIVCYDYSRGVYKAEYKFPNSVGHRIFSVAYAPVDGGKFYVVNGPNFQPPYNSVKGFIINIPKNSVEAAFGDFQNPHGIAVNQIGSVVYIVEYRPSKLHKFEVAFERKTAANLLLQKPEKQVAEKSTSFIGHIVLGLVVSVIILMIVAMVYYFRFKREGLKRYGRILEGGDTNESVSLFPQDGQD